MELLNELYSKSCKPKCESYKKISSHITLIDNFFEDFDKARNFFISREKWECIPYQDYSKPGYESLFPSWIGESLMEKYVLDNKINDYMKPYNVTCNSLYNQSNLVWSLSNSNYFPHIDGVENNNILRHICLINLNNIPVSTNFYTYKNQEYCSSEMKTEWYKYDENIQKELLNHYNKKTIKRDEVKIFLDKKQDLSIKLIKEVKYKPNQAIVYPVNLFHSPDVPEKFTEDNHRVLLKIGFNIKVVEYKNNFMYQ